MTSLPDQIDLARAALGEAPAYRRRGVGALVVPRADVEVDVDMENVEGGCYLWGSLVARDGTDMEYVPFITWATLTPDVEAANSLAFWRWLMALRGAAHAAGRTFRAYCWHAPAENGFLRRLGRACAMVEEVEAFIAGDEWVDMLRVWESQLITGKGSGLKVVALLAGFVWDVDDAGGGSSMVMYDVAATGDADARNWLLSYNRSDVMATRAVREWMGRNDVRGVEALSATSC
jgi:predicted RecB family nuclease